MAETSSKLDKSARYSVRGWRGVAFYIHGFPLRWEPYTYLAVDDDGEEYEAEDGDGEWEEQDENCGRVIVVMVGDDRRHTVDVGDLEKLGDEDCCGECGQIGCTADGRDRSEQEQD